MWLITDHLPESEEIPAVIGRTLFVCQKYEITCKDIISWLETTRSLVDKKIEFLSEEYLSYVDKLHKILLGRAIQKLEKNALRFGVSKQDFQCLDLAKQSRNWLVHESCTELITSHFSGRNKTLTLPVEFREHVKTVVRGDFLVSKWSYQFHEKETAPWFRQDTYVERVVKWVFEGHSIRNHLA